MNIQQFHMGFERKIGYSFLGLLAGNAASLSAFLIIATLQPFLPDKFTHYFFRFDLPRALGMSVFAAIVSLMGWTVVGLPVVLLLPARVAGRLRWFAAPIGAALGAFTLFLIFLALDRGRLDWASYTQTQTLQTFVPPAVLISGVAFTVYCALIRGELEDHPTESGAPSGAPQSSSAVSINTLESSDPRYLTSPESRQPDSKLS